MKRALILLSLSLVSSFCASAKMLTAESALERYNASASGDKPLKIHSITATCVYSYSVNDINTCYVYSYGSDRGFVILSGSDKAPALLGYSEQGNFSSADIPAALKGWLDECGEMILSAESNGLKVAGAPVVPGLQSVAPIAKTKWNQNSPYNDLCPLEDGKHTYTGCAATAVSQVMKTYSYPETGEGVFSYNWHNQELNVNYGNQVYNWSQMLDVYDASAPEAQKREIANLMYTVGVSGKMNYGTNSSSAAGIDMALGLVRNFRYDKGLRYVPRDYYKLDEWCRMLHGELSQGHAVYYEGQSSQGGHAFVIDGYNSDDGFFHVNWGWGGLSDGYFNIVTLEPSLQGIGGSISGFKTNQAAIFNLKPAQVDSEYVPSVCINTDFKTVERTYKRNQDIEFIGGSYGKGIIPFSIVALEYTYGVKLTDDNGNVSYVWSKEISDKMLNPVEGMTSYTVSASEFPEEGVYTMTPVFKCQGRIYDVKVAINCSQAVKCTATASELKFKTVSVTPQLSFGMVEFNSSLCSGRPFKASVEVVNNGEEYLGTISGVIMKNYSVIGLYNLGKYDIPNGATEKIQFEGDIAENVAPGEYQFAFTAEDGNIVSELQNIEIQEATGQTEAVIENVRFPLNDGGNGTPDDPVKVYSQTFLMDADLHCTSGYFTQQVLAMIFRASGGSNIGALEAQQVKVSEGETVTLNFAYDISPVCNVGETYALLFAKYDGSEASLFSPESAYFFKVVGATSGIDGIADDAEPVKIEYFDLMGRKVENPGKDMILIKRSTYASGETSVAKVAY